MAVSPSLKGSQTNIANRHDFDTTFTMEYDENQTAVAVITPTDGKKIKVTGVFVSTEGATTAGQGIRLYFATSSDTVAKVICTNAVTNVAITPICIEGARNEALSLTSNLGEDKNYFIAINYREE